MYTDPKTESFARFDKAKVIKACLAILESIEKNRKIEKDKVLDLIVFRRLVPNKKFLLFFPKYERLTVEEAKNTIQPDTGKSIYDTARDSMEKLLSKTNPLHWNDLQHKYNRACFKFRQQKRSVKRILKLCELCEEDHVFISADDLYWFEEDFPK